MWALVLGPGTSDPISELPVTFKESIPVIEADDLNNVVAEPAFNEANIRTIIVLRLIVAVNAAKFYDAVGCLRTPQIMHYGNFLSDFKVEWDAYGDLRTKE